MKPFKTGRSWFAGMLLLLSIPVVVCTGAEPANRPGEKGQARLAWNRQTLVEAYEKVGRTNAAWDDAAKAALEAFAVMRSGPPESIERLAKEIGQHCRTAKAARCADPMVEYLHVRYVVQDEVQAGAYAQALGSAANGLAASKYPAIRKLFGAIRAAEQFQSIKEDLATIGRYRRVAARYATNVVEDATTPIEEIDEACSDLLNLLATNARGLEDFYQSIEYPLLRNWPNDYRTWLVKGKFYRRHAWRARGGGFADTVTEEGWKIFADRLKVANAALEKAWNLNQTDARVPIEMMEIVIGQGKNRERLDLWFDRAMKINTNSYEACRFKQRYLMPKWHGSEEEMLAFGRECTTSKGWGGHVPLMLVECHEYIANQAPYKGNKTYWKKPGVWEDLTAAYERFFELNPRDTGHRHNYARFAYWCEAWDDLHKQIPLLGPVNHEFFGGKAEFDTMVARAKERAR